MGPHAFRPELSQTLAKPQARSQQRRTGIIGNLWGHAADFAPVITGSSTRVNQAGSQECRSICWNPGRQLTTDLNGLWFQTIWSVYGCNHNDNILNYGFKKNAEFWLYIPVIKIWNHDGEVVQSGAHQILSKSSPMSSSSWSPPNSLSNPKQPPDPCQTLNSRQTPVKP
jgi:hypothetical protein